MPEKDPLGNEIVQKTVRKSIPISGFGPKTGQAVTIVIRPARPDTGIMFLRRDAPPGEGIFEAFWYDLEESTTPDVVTNQYGFSVSSIQPLVSLLRCLAIDNAVIEMDGPECPVTNDSAQQIVHVLEETGTTSQRLWKRNLEN